MATAGNNLSSFEPSQVPPAKGCRFGILVSEWNSEITDKLAQGAKDTLLELGAEMQSILIVSVPGSFELPIASKLLIESDSFDAVIAVGSVIQGETRHFEFVCNAVAQGIKDVSLQSGVPVIFCVLTDDTLEQARARAGGIHGNKGVEAAVAAVKMASLKRDFCSDTL